jgi:uncharacterized Fe-S cluster protein YjdI
MSADREIVKEYQNGDLTVVWKPQKCIHAAECVKRLPNVYNPDEKPWIKAENATVDELKDQIKACPSGALTYKIKNESMKEDQEVNTEIQVLKNGPLLVSGTLNVKKPDGTMETKDNSTAFCRCGASQNKPYCDGKHKAIAFEG